jgi:hypothetical protein|tara:strand:- start:995 stop:1330 length:336 start_codon:yes stop_codon:yes gene_type:complete
MKFTTKLSGNRISIFNYSDKDADESGEFKIEWYFYTEVRDWGVKNIGVYATNIKGTVELNYLDVSESKKIEINSDNDDWDLQTETNLKWGDDINPQELEVDFETKTLTLLF